MFTPSRPLEAGDALMLMADAEIGKLKEQNRQMQSVLRRCEGAMLGILDVVPSSEARDILEEIRGVLNRE